MALDSYRSIRFTSLSWQMVIASPIKPEILDWAIDESGYDPVDLARKVGVGSDELLSWTVGEAVAPKGKVTEILKRLKRSPDIVYLNEVPEAARLKAHFRTMKVAGKSVSLTPEEIHVVREAHYIQHFLSEMLMHGKADRVQIADELQLQRSGPVEEQGAKVRNWVTVNQSPVDGREFKQWRALVEARSVFVVMVNLSRVRGEEDSSTDDSSRLRGFSLPHDLAPLVVVCTDNTQAKTFTLFHELAHLGLQDGETGACHVPIVSSDAVERWCDRVAGGALVPVDALRECVTRRRLLDVTEDRMIDIVSDEFAVSKRAAAVAVEDGLGIQGLYRRTDGRLSYRDRNPRSPSGGGPGWDRIELRLRKYGRGLVKTVFKHLARGHVTEAQVRRFLGLGGDEICDATRRASVHVAV